MADTVQQIKDRLSIVDVVSQYVKLDRAGATLRARCPFHSEKTPSFFVSPERGTYHCFGCGVGGDMFSFVEAIEGVDFKGALKLLADRAGVELVYEQGNSKEKDERERLFEIMEVATLWFASHLNEEAKVYLRGRGVEEQMIRAFRIGYVGNEWSELSDHLKAKKFAEVELIAAGLSKKNERGTLTDKFRNRIMFPIADTVGRIVAFSGRSFGEHASPEAPKYLNSPETMLFHKSRILYGFDKAKLSMRKADCAVLVEGQLDLVLAHQAGWTNTVAVSGTAFTEEHGKLIGRHTQNLVIALDGDQAGIKAAVRAAREALRGGLHVKVAQLPDGQDPADVISKLGVDAWKHAIRDAKDIVMFLLDVLERSKGSVDASLANERFRKGVESIVLPFLSDIASPIAREQYVRDIARRLGVSEDAVLASLQQVPLPATNSAPTPVSTDIRTSRSDHALALLLWQESLPEPRINVEHFRSELERLLGSGALQAAQDPVHVERYRFAAERFFGNLPRLQEAADELLRSLHEDDVRRKLTFATKELQKAEQQDDAEKMAELEDKIRLLTTEIAQLHKKS